MVAKFLSITNALLSLIHIVYIRPRYAFTSYSTVMSVMCSMVSFPQRNAVPLNDYHVFTAATGHIRPHILHFCYLCSLLTRWLTKDLLLGSMSRLLTNGTCVSTVFPLTVSYPIQNAESFYQCHWFACGETSKMVLFCFFFNLLLTRVERGGGKAW